MVICKSNNITNSIAKADGRLAMVAPIKEIQLLSYPQKNTGTKDKK
jgi:hypothetical protein